MNLGVISWNLFHGRDAPPDRSLHSWRSRLTTRPERGTTHIQVNRDLLPEFTTVLEREEPGWDIALLQECPPRWLDSLRARLGAEACISLTSRNSLPRLRAAIARRTPDLIASGEGGSNLTLVRPSAGQIVLRREITLCPGPFPERRTMAFVELSTGVCVGNMHLTNDQPDLASEQLLKAAAAADRWAGDHPLILGGDFNLRPAERPDPFRELEELYGLRQPTSPRAIDHILARGLNLEAVPTALPAVERELLEDGLTMRLSDHAPVHATFRRD